MKPTAPEPLPLAGDAKEWADKVIHRHYFPHIDGLRCLAVLPVVFYHLASNTCPGGFVGVDIFFVISGFLIYGGILDDLQRGSFSLASFYHRRIRRIYPAYFILVCCTLLAGVALFSWVRLLSLAQTTLFSNFFSTNLYFWLNIGYFQPIATSNALLHLWTLGVEEQFYIVIPLLSLALWKLSRASLKPALIVMFLVSLALCVELGRHGQSTTAFYILPTRAWELLAGALLAGRHQREESLHASLYALLGAALVVASFCCLSTAHTAASTGTSAEVLIPYGPSFGIFAFPGFTTVPVIVGSLLLLRHGRAGLLSPILCSRPFVGIGKISYSLYLWHWPIIVFARYVEYDHQTPLDLALVFLLSLLAAYLSWRWIEMPIRVSQAFTPRIAFSSVGISCTVLAAACAVLIATEGLRNIIHTKANYYASASLPFLSNLDKFFPVKPFRPPPYPALDDTYIKLIGETGQKPSFLLIGDSNARALAPGFDRVAAENHRAGLYIAKRLHPYIEDSLASIDQQLLHWSGENPDAHDVYLVCNWARAHEIWGQPNLGDKGRVQPVVVDPKLLSEIEAYFRRTAHYFIEHGKRVYVFTSVPEYGYEPADLMARSQIIPLHYPIEMTRSDYMNRQQPLLDIFSRLQSEGLITVIPLDRALFDGDTSVFMAPDGKPYYRDGDHLTPDGAYEASRAIAPLLWPSATAEPPTHL